jgi:hypothetical protein
VVVSKDLNRRIIFGEKKVTCSVMSPPRRRKFHSISLMAPSNFNTSAQRRKLNTSLSFSNKPLETKKKNI